MTKSKSKDKYLPTDWCSSPPEFEDTKMILDLLVEKVNILIDQVQELKNHLENNNDRSESNN